MQADKIATGHNADDIAETVLLNILRGDLPRLSRCAAIITGESCMSHAIHCLLLNAAVVSACIVGVMVQNI